VRVWCPSQKPGKELTTLRALTKIITPISFKNVLCQQNGRINKKRNQIPDFLKKKK
jgi:hypothetical protein